MARIPGPILRTERLYLQTPRARDVREVYAWCRDPAITRHMSWDAPRKPADTRAWVRVAQAEQRAGRGVAFVLHERDTGRPIGCCGLHHVDRSTHLKAETGYWIARPYWGRGLVSEAMDALLVHAFGTLGLHRVCAQVFPRNPRSARVLERLGFTFEGTLRHNIRKNGRGLTVHQYSLLATDPAARRILRQAARR